MPILTPATTIDLLRKQIEYYCRKARAAMESGDENFEDYITAKTAHLSRILDEIIEGEEA